MDGKQTQDFAARLAREFEVIPRTERDELIFTIGRRDIEMREVYGQLRPVWKGPAPAPELLGREVVGRTDMGERPGRVVFFGVTRVGGEYEHSCIVHVPSSGTWFEAPASCVRLADGEDIARMEREREMVTRLRAVAATEDDGTGTEAPRKAPRLRRRSDPAFYARIMEATRSVPHLVVLDQKGFHKVGRTTELASGRRIYIARNGGRIALAGFCLEHPGIIAISAEEAAAMGQGTVRGEIDLSDPERAMDALRVVLEAL